MARTETRPDEPAPWLLLRALGPEFMDVAVRAQVAWHGPTAAWAIAIDLRAGQGEVVNALDRLMESGEVVSIRQLDGDQRYMLAEWAFQPRGHTDLWAFALSWLARRTFAERFTLSCPSCSGLGYSEREWLGTDAELERAEAGPSAVHAVLENEQWRITARSWCSTCYRDDKGDLGRVESTVAELIDFVARLGPATSAGEQLSVLGDGIQARGELWGEWIAALLNGSMMARREHEEAMAKAVRARLPKVPHSVEAIVEGGDAQAIGRQLAALGRPPGGLGGSGSDVETWRRWVERAGAGVSDSLMAVAVAAGEAAQTFGGFNRALAELGQTIGMQRENRASYAKMFDLDLTLIEAAMQERGHDAVLGDLQRGDHGPYRWTLGSSRAVEQLHQAVAEIAAILADPGPQAREHRRGPVGDQLRRRLERGRRRR